MLILSRWLFGKEPDAPLGEVLARKLKERAATDDTLGTIDTDGVAGGKGVIAGN